MSDSKATPFEEWCIVEIFGHQRYAGLVSEAEIGGCKFVRLDVPEVTTRGWNDEAVQPAFTKLFGQGAIYCVTPTTEELARKAAAEIGQRPMGTLCPAVLVDKQLAGADQIDDEPDDYDSEECPI